ncbi:hypothetical protein HGRIS_009098 [Hohenbuehelia grisea]|uniref:Cytochrome P450 n=1 Tax=Hohenbuehelia grisea TaxID=104357 RepID=A0ABR3J079_9AGAR
MAIDLPPILPYAFERLPRLIAPLALVYALRKSIEAFTPHVAAVIPGWLWAITYLFILPLQVALGAQYADWRDAREARRHGAVLVPSVKDNTPGGLGVLRSMNSSRKNGYLAEIAVQRSKELGNTFNINILWENRIFTSEPEYIKIILATEFDSFEKGPGFFHQMESLLGTGVFNSDGDMWKFHRSMTRPFFSKERISHFELFGRHADDAISQLRARLKQGYAVDAQDIASRFTLDSATEFLFGQNVHSLAAGLPYPYTAPESRDQAYTQHPANVFARAFAEAQLMAALRGRYGASWPLNEPWRLKTAPHMRIVRNFIDPIVTEAIAKRRATTQGASVGMKGDREVKEGETLLDHLVNYTDDERVLRDETLNIMIAGRDTTANTITFATYMLAEHPQAFKRLREEILTKVGPSRRPTLEDMREMKYLRAVINETLRLYPAVPFNIRTSRRALLLPGKDGKPPFYIPARTRVPYSVFIMHRRTDLWGPDAEEFDPDRFLDERLHKYLTPNPFIFLPFNAGPRICLGQQFAYHEASFFLIRLLQSFSKIELSPQAQPPQSKPPQAWQGAPGKKGKEKIWPKGHLTMYAEGGLWVTMEEAQDEQV